MIRFSNARSGPTVVIGDVVIIGFDQARIAAALQE
jgi:hypothetical protein